MRVVRNYNHSKVRGELKNVIKRFRIISTRFTSIEGLTPLENLYSPQSFTSNLYIFMAIPTLLLAVRVQFHLKFPCFYFSIRRAVVFRSQDKVLNYTAVFEIY